jgi:hypothetical protein
MADAWRVPAILTLLVGCWHVAGPLEHFKKALALILDKAKLIVSAFASACPCWPANAAARTTSFSKTTAGS